MQQLTLFSVLIANYNNGDYIHEAINSVIRQSFKNWEIIIVDDASTDNSLQVIEHFLNDKRIHLFCNDKNYGCGYTKRKAAELASGEICGFLDADDMLTDNALDVMVNAYSVHPGCSLIYSTHYVCDSNLNNPVKSAYTGPMEKGYSFLVNRGKKNISHFATFKKQNYNETAGIDATLKKAVDHDLYFKLEESAPTLFIDECLYKYRIHNSGISTGKNVVPALIQHYTVRINAIQRRLAKQHLLDMYPKDARFIKYQYLRCSFYLNKLKGNKPGAFKFLIRLLSRYPFAFSADVLTN